MSKSKVMAKASKEAVMTKVRDENAIPLILPYYCSWYKCVFSGHSGRTDAELKESIRED